MPWSGFQDTFHDFDLCHRNYIRIRLIFFHQDMIVNSAKCCINLSDFTKKISKTEFDSKVSINDSRFKISHLSNKKKALSRMQRPL